MPILRILLVMALAAALAGCGATGRDAPDDDPTAAEMHEDARRLLARGAYEPAIQRLERLQGRYPFSDEARQGQLDIIFAHYQLQQHESAIAAANRFIRMHPRDPHAAYAVYMRGLSRMESGETLVARTFNLDRTIRDPEPLRRAFDDFRELIETFPESEYVDSAREHMYTLREMLASYELYVARFYASRDAHVAAINRAREVIDVYRGTEAVGEALILLADSYAALELDDLAQEVREMLELEIPRPVGAEGEAEPQDPT